MNDLEGMEFVIILIPIIIMAVLVADTIISTFIETNDNETYFIDDDYWL